MSEEEMIGETSEELIEEEKLKNETLLILYILFV